MEVTEMERPRDDSQPFLLRFAVVRGPQRQTEPDGVYYDPDLQMTVVDFAEGPRPVIDLPDYAGALTKKQDMERSEDQKDPLRPPPSPPRPPSPPQPSSPRPRTRP
jgi:hypothetical protein